MYLAVLGVNKDTIEMDLRKLGAEVKEARIIYPEKHDSAVSYMEGYLAVNLPQKKCARLLELEF